MIALKRILVPHDFSETAAAAVSHAAGFARAFGADLLFLHVGERAAVDDYLESSLGLDGAASDAVRARLLDTVGPAELTGVSAQFFERTGQPADAIIGFAIEHDVDLIMMGTHGRGFVGHMVMGSVAEMVVRRAPCPVLTVRHRARAAEAFAVVDDAREAARAAV
jgi:nucleotide-binding universal stress UspA family protein